MGRPRVIHVGVVTGSRADYGIYLPLLRRIQADRDFKLSLFVTGAHLSSKFGFTYKAIENDGFVIAEKIEMLQESDSPEGIAKSSGAATAGFAEAFSRTRPGILFALGDRIEMLSAVIAALPFKIPVAHIHGGELTEGAIDDCMRHAITKLSHLHFVSTEEYGKRIVQMGEQPARVVVSGAPSLDNLSTFEPLTVGELAKIYNLSAERPFLLVTYHPVTLHYETTEEQMEGLISALETSGMDVLFTYPNADTAHRSIIDRIKAFANRFDRVKVIVSTGVNHYFSLMSHAAAMVGNSSSGIIEAASFRLPVVNIGPRQKGRIRAANVIDVECNALDILRGIRQAVDPAFRSKLNGLVNPYGDGRASERIVRTLKETDLDTLPHKTFYSYQ